MKNLFIFTTLLFLLHSCSLTSTTYIQANDAFVLGNNQHGRFSVKLKNLAVNDLIIWKTPIDGGQHSPITAKPNETVKVKVERNTALKIENNNPAEATVELIIKGDTGLSMGYKNQ